MRKPQPFIRLMENLRHPPCYSLITAEYEYNKVASKMGQAFIFTKAKVGLGSTLQRAPKGTLLNEQLRMNSLCFLFPLSLHSSPYKQGPSRMLASKQALVYFPRWQLILNLKRENILFYIFSSFWASNLYFSKELIYKSEVSQEILGLVLFHSR